MKPTAIAAGLALAVLGGAIAQAQSPPDLTVVELFTSQGCSSCPPANANVGALAGRPDILALSFSVTYWDRLGWKDTFAQEAFTQRQYDYEETLGHDAPFTPQVLVNGHGDTVGDRAGDIARLIAQERRAPLLAVSLAPGDVTLGAGNGTAEVWLVRYDPRLVQVAVGRGENAGVTLPHRNVVHELTLLGNWRGAAEHFALPPAPSGLKTAILVQRGKGGPIIAAARD